MPLSNYTELRASIADTLNRDDLTSAIPDFITLAEAQLSRDLRHWRMEDRANATMDQQYTTLPLNFISPIRITIPASPSYTLELVSPFELSKLRMENSATTGRPQFYAVVDGAFEVFPTPDADYTVELVYYESIPDLATNTTNWLLTNYPDAYLYSSLIHSSPFLQEDQRVAVWNTLYLNAVSAINLEGERARTSGSGRRIQIRSY
tara:strand:- start:1060 stop:1677 length:618 start_codon:yes stop_codon:yes gene_type:complete